MFVLPECPDDELVTQETKGFGEGSEIKEATERLYISRVERYDEILCVGTRLWLLIAPRSCAQRGRA
jgi:hypothetical protein